MTDHAELFDARADLAHIRDFARARRVSPLAVLGTTLALAIVHTPPEVVLPPMVGEQASLNLFVALVGRSGQGKGTAEAAGMALLDMPDPVTPSSIGSGEGLPALYVRTGYETTTDPETGKTTRRAVTKQYATRALLSVPEVDTLYALSKRSGATLGPELRKAYMGEPLGFQYAAMEKRLPVVGHSYRLALIVGVQPARADALLNADEIGAGTPQRYLWLPTADPDAPDARPDEPAGTLPWSVPNLAHCPIRRFRRELPVCDAARDLVDTNRLASLRGDIDAIDTHAVLTRLKVAAALGLLAGRAGITDDDWHLSAALMAISDETRAVITAELATRAAADNEARGRSDGARQIIVDRTVDSDRTKRVAANIRRRLASDGVTAHAALLRKVAHRDRDYFDDAIMTLIVAGEVDEEKTDDGRSYRYVPQ
jgi:hypothetical protein